MRESGKPLKHFCCERVNHNVTMILRDIRSWERKIIFFYVVYSLSGTRDLEFYFHLSCWVDSTLITYLIIDLGAMVVE